MLHLLFQSIEQALGPSAWNLAHLVYAMGMGVLGMVAVTAAYRLWRDWCLTRAGVMQEWVAPCPHCQQTSFITGGRCDYCEKELRLPWIVKRLVSTKRSLHRPLLRYVALGARLLGMVAFVAVSLSLIGTIGALRAEGTLHRLFAGATMLSWAAVWLYSARVFGPGPLAGRVTDGLLAFAAIGVLAVTMFLTDAARAQNEWTVAHVTVGQTTASIGSHMVSVPTGELRFEYLQVDHDLVGYHRIIPLAVTGQERVLLVGSAFGQWVATRLARHADGRPRRGLLVRLRTEHLRITPGQAYLVIQREGEVFLRRADAI